MIRIIKAEAGVGIGTKVSTEGGADIEGITELTISIRPDDLVTATVEVMVADLDVAAHPLLGLDSLRAAAKAYGYTLVKA